MSHVANRPKIISSPEDSVIVNGSKWVKPADWQKKNEINLVFKGKIYFLV